MSTWENRVWADELLRRADLALITAKPEHVATRRYAVELETRRSTADVERAELRAVIDTPDAIVAVFQPIFDLRTREIVGYDRAGRVEHHPQLGALHMDRAAPRLELDLDPPRRDTLGLGGDQRDVGPAQQLVGPQPALPGGHADGRGRRRRRGALTRGVDLGPDAVDIHRPA